MSQVETKMPSQYEKLIRLFVLLKVTILVSEDLLNNNLPELKLVSRNPICCKAEALVKRALASNPDSKAVQDTIDHLLNILKNNFDIKVPIELIPKQLEELFANWDGFLKKVIAHNKL